MPHLPPPPVAADANKGEVIALTHFSLTLYHHLLSAVAFVLHHPERPQTAAH
jgi:hypothetical protein